MRHKETNTQLVAAAKSGMDVKTARKYLKKGLLPSDLKKTREWRTRKDPFYEDKHLLESFLESAPNLQANTLLAYLMKQYPGKYNLSMLRTLQRRLQGWKAEHGLPKSVIFNQVHVPGQQSQSDYTVMDSLQITLSGQAFNHLLFHFMLVYSRWEWVSICHSESFESLLAGFEQAVWTLGGSAKDHRTDNLSAATRRAKSKRAFTERWQTAMNHYGITPSRNNPGESHENGSVEKSHDLFKTAVEQALLLRGSRDFESLESYRDFLKGIVNMRNAARKEAVLEEMKQLRSLPQDKWYSPKVRLVRVRSNSTVQIDKVAYSVPSRLIGYALQAHVYPEDIELYYGRSLLQKMGKQKEALINYRHIIDSLVRKPGAFKQYQYREALFPNEVLKNAYQALWQASKANGHKSYLALLQLAKNEGEQAVSCAIELLAEAGDLPLPEAVKSILFVPVRLAQVKVDPPNLSVYNGLLANLEGMSCQ